MKPLQDALAASRENSITSNKQAPRRRWSDQIKRSFQWEWALVALGLCAIVYRVEANSWLFSSRAIAIEKKSITEAAKTAKLVADAKVNPLPEQIKKIEKRQAAADKKVETNETRIITQQARLRRDLEMCRMENADKQAQIEALKKELAFVRRISYDRSTTNWLLAKKALAKAEQTRKDVGLHP